MPTAMRAPFIIRNIWLMPAFSTPPTRVPTQPSFSPKLRTQVAEALMPILCSMPPTVTSLGAPSEPSGCTRILGTTKSESPLVPGAAPSMRASTRCTTLGTMSLSPAEM